MPSASPPRSPPTPAPASTSSSRGATASWTRASPAGSGPSSRPVCRDPVAAPRPAELATGPARPPLLGEGPDALGEVGAGVGARDEVVPVGKRARRPDAPDGLLGDLDGDGRVLDELGGESRHARVDLLRGHDLVDEARR